MLVQRNKAREVAMGRETEGRGKRKREKSMHTKGESVSSWKWKAE